MTAVRLVGPATISLLALQLACVAARPARSQVTQKLCGPEIPGVSQLLAPAAFILLGEMHGTNEIPYVVGELACEAGTAGQRVTVAVEMAEGEQAHLDRYLASSGSPEDQRRLFAGAFWNRPYQDGRSSKAMAAMLERLRALRHAGVSIRVVAYDVAGLEGNAHEEAMAQNLLDDRREHPDETYLVLCGNVRARTVAGVDWDEAFVPMGMRLKQSVPRLRALDAEYAPGQAWTCKLAQPITCGVEWIAAPRRASFKELPPPQPTNQHLVGTHPAPGAVYDPQPKFRGYRPFVRLSSSLSPEGYDGYFYVGPITPSPPATTASLGPG